MKAQLSKLIPAVLALCVLNAAAATRYVDLNSPSPTPPYTSWSTAATNIQDAVDAASAGDLILVTNGVYASGGRVVYGSLTNRVAVDKAVIIQSVNGPDVTAIEGFKDPGTVTGDSAVRCVYMTSGASLIGFTLTNGATRFRTAPLLEVNGGGVWCESDSAILSNCVLVANVAARYGGGSYSGTLNYCTIVSNISSIGTSSYGAGGCYLGKLNSCLLMGNLNYFGSGGGAMSSVLSNCVLVGNSTMTGGRGGGASDSILNNCLLTNNYTAGGGGGAYASALTNCSVVNNSAYSSGGGTYDGSLSFCFVSNNSATNTAASGGGTYNSIVVNSMVSSNWARQSGGGAYGGPVVNSSLLGNVAHVNGGGGAASGNLTNCLLFGNRAANGGGAWQGTLNNCTVVGNSATNSGGGLSGSTARNSIVYYNTAPTGSNQIGGSLTYSCIPGLPVGTGNVTNAPLFVDLTSGNLRLQSNSPCINVGLNSYVALSTDLDGRPRIVGGTVDIGAYEYQPNASGVFIAWLQNYALPTDGSADFADPDADDMNNYGEWRSDTIPTNALSVLLMVAATNSPTAAQVTWQSVATRSYWLERATNLGSVPPFSAIASNIAGVSGTKTYTDASATNAGPYFYRVGVQ